MSLSLNCLVVGDDPDRVFTVEIPKNKNVSILKKLIKEEKAPHLDHVAASDLDLWQVSFPIDDLETELGNIDLAGYPKLSPPSKKLSTFFTDVADDCLHVIAKVPEVQTVVALDPTQLLSLNCFILGDDPDRVFTVEIPKNKNVSILKKLIKEEKAPHLDHVAASDLDLWQVSFPIDDLSSKNPPTVGPKLRAEKFLLDAFSSELDANRIHVVARVPSKGAPSPSSGPPPSAYKFPVLSADQVGRDREKFCSQRKSEAPSNGGNPQTFLNRQDKADGYIPCNRPYGRPTALPLSLLHPIFGEYVDDAENYVPTTDDVKFFLAFVQAMANIYKREDGRQETLLTIFDDHKIPIKPTMIGRFTTDGDLSIGKFRFLIAEFKNEIGSTAAEPFFQAILYFLEATRKLATQHLNSVLPCMIVLIFGPYVAFAGAAWTDRPTVQMLSPAIPCHYQDTDIKMEGMLVRHLGALRRAIHALDTYYQEYSANPSFPLRNPTHPYPTSFTSWDGSAKRFIYLFHMKGRNLFFGRMDDIDGTAICIKFVARYCKEGHEFLAAKGFAPKLHAVERLPGGLYMVVMDDVSEEYISLFNLIRDNPDFLSEEHLGARNCLSEKVGQCLRQFHQAGFVHGDIRDTNIMVKTLKRGGNDGSFLVVDYDSSGRIKQARYPLNLNTTSVQRPEGATGGAVVEVEHDLEMLDHIWDP
ncbi:hypothetical protein NLJ89_g9993 [Agrocybe chaxingu]|uniref:Crinkler effector protein N-terminal domain-containing protein n=1 Tax=Agrocybe chaxingu TaxID=84603 RepID=A0A9W8JSI4_9AGAR|nr:hypothetical protein NLJ89_g9993 [Agrocybe chaxingu]